MSIEKNQTAVIPTNDYVFKRIFGKVGNEFITKEFLSVILDRKLTSVNLEGNTILEKELLDDKLGILDIKAKLDNNILCDIEMQVINNKNIEKRILYYWSKLYSSGIKSGENYDKLNKTISILLINYELNNLKDILKGHTEWKIREKNFKNTVLTDMLEIHIIELPKVKRLINTDFIFKEDKDFSVWTKFLLKPNELEEIDMKGNLAVKKAKEELDKIKRDEYEERIAELRMKHILDSNSLKAEGYEDGFEAGKIEGKVEGKIEGKMEGKMEGKIEGMLKERNDNAIEMLKNGYSIEEISKILKLSEIEIKRLSHNKI